MNLRDSVDPMRECIMTDDVHDDAVNAYLILSTLRGEDCRRTLTHGMQDCLLHIDMPCPRRADSNIFSVRFNREFEGA